MAVGGVLPVPVERLAAGDFRGACDAGSLVYFLLNVGDGDTQLVLLPTSAADGRRRALVVDVATEDKLPSLIDELARTDSGAALLPDGSRFAITVATHPHDDHIGGMPQFVDRFHEVIDELWEPGFFHPAPAYLELMHVLEDHKTPVSQPTAGMTRFVESTRVTVLAPNVELRGRYDTYGTDINDASISLLLEFPASRSVQEANDRRYRKVRTQRLLLGADAQTLSWGRTMFDFANLLPEASDTAKFLASHQGTEPLSAQVFKVPHHGSKRGVNLELVERIGPSLCLVSSVLGGGKYNFPHDVALGALREALQRTATTGKPYDPDYELGIHFTGAVDDRGVALGSIAVIVPPSGRHQVWRFRDSKTESVVLDKGVRFQPRPP